MKCKMEALSVLENTLRLLQLNGLIDKNGFVQDSQKFSKGVSELLGGYPAMLRDIPLFSFDGSYAKPILSSFDRLQNYSDALVQVNSKAINSSNGSMTTIGGDLLPEIKIPKNYKSVCA